MTTLLTIAAIVLVLFLLFKIFKIVVRLLLIAIFLVIAYLTNPDIESHQRAVEAKAVREKFKLRRKAVAINDYKIFSLTYLLQADAKKLVGVGLFTKVWIFGELSEN